MPSSTSDVELDPKVVAVYRRALEALTRSKVPFLVGGGYALARYTGIHRHTKDFDVFTMPEDGPTLLKVLADAGFQTELTFPHWLGKAYEGQEFIDVIFSSGNAVARVDAEWFEHAVETDVLGMPVRVSPPEEMIWSKSFIMERERFDGADIAHLVRALGVGLDWDRLLRRFGHHWRILLAHLVLFGFIYPSEQSQLPVGVMDELLRRVQAEQSAPPLPARVCQGTLLSRSQYLTDIDQWGYQDARRAPVGGMTDTEIKIWTDAITP